MTPTITALAIALLVTVVPATAAAQTVARPGRAAALKKTSLFLSGAAAGLGVHESGHVLFGAILGGHPSVARIDYGPVPFFAIHHDDVTRRREFVISSAGFWMQHAGSEWLLSKRPHLKDERAPFAKGVLTFNIATSVQLSVLDLASSVGEVLGQKPKLEFAPARAGELARSALDVSKAKRVLGWSPQYQFQDGLRELVDWFKKEAR